MRDASPDPWGNKTASSAEEVPLMGCVECQSAYHGDCPKHPFRHVRHEPVPAGDEQRSIKTLPAVLYVASSTMKPGKYGVYAAQALPSRVVFGPYEGVRISDTSKSTSYTWQVPGTGKPVDLDYRGKWGDGIPYLVDGRPLGQSNWMRYVQAAQYEEEQNLTAFAGYDGRIYFRTRQAIAAGQELLVRRPGPFGWQPWFVTLPSDEEQDVPDGVVLCAACKKLRLGSGPHCHECTAERRELQRDQSPPVESADGRQLRSSRARRNGLGRKRQRAPQPRSRPNSKSPRTPAEKQRGPKLPRDQANVRLRRNVKHSADLDRQQQQHSAGQLVSRRTGSARLSNHSSFSSRRPHQCPKCRRCFSRRDHLKRHLDTHKRGGGSGHFCQVCGARFGRKDHAGRHERLAHAASHVKHPCSVCERRFSRADGLTKHLATHRGDKPHSCTVCGRRFSRKDHIQRHLQASHGGGKPHPCTVCGKRFARKDHLKKHLATHTPRA